MSVALTEALEQKRAAEQQVSDVMKRDYPVGAIIAWSRGGREQEGTVLKHGYGGRAQVFNGRTGKEVCVKAYEVLE